MLILLCTLSLLSEGTTKCKYKCRLWKRWVLRCICNFLMFYLDVWITYIAVTERDGRRFSNCESNVTVLEKFIINER